METKFNFDVTNYFTVAKNCKKLYIGEILSQITDVEQGTNTENGDTVIFRNGSHFKINGKDYIAIKNCDVIAYRRSGKEA